MVLKYRGSIAIDPGKIKKQKISVRTQLLNVKRLGANWKSAFQVKTAPFQNKPFISFVAPIQRKQQQIVGRVSAAHDPSRLQEKGNKQEGEERTNRGTKQTRRGQNTGEQNEQEDRERERERRQIQTKNEYR